MHMTRCGAVGSALALGARCRRFESCHLDQIKAQTLIQKQPSNLEGCFCVYTQKTLILLAFRAFYILSAAGIRWINPPETYRAEPPHWRWVQKTRFLNPPTYKNGQKITA